MKKWIRYLLVIGVLFSILIFILAYTYVIKPGMTASALERRYQKIEKGMPLKQVVSHMGDYPYKELGCHVVWWGQDELSKEEIKRIDKNIIYSVKTFYLPISFGFSFDSSGKVAGKHRYD